jgi:hypothetical protein
MAAGLTDPLMGVDNSNRRSTSGIPSQVGGAATGSLPVLKGLFPAAGAPDSTGCSFPFGSTIVREITWSLEGFNASGAATGGMLSLTGAAVREDEVGSTVCSLLFVSMIAAGINGTLAGLSASGEKLPPGVSFERGGAAAKALLTLTGAAVRPAGGDSTGCCLSFGSAVPAGVRGKLEGFGAFDGKSTPQNPGMGRLNSIST